MEQRLCLYCQQPFLPNKYSPRQRVCSEANCQKKRQDESMRLWRSKNPNYFKYDISKGPEWLETQRARSKLWRQRNTAELRAYRQAHILEYREYMRNYMKNYRKRAKV